MTDLAAQLTEFRRTIATDSYPMSIGELANLYRDGELNIHPEFQRVFRWNDLQRTRLIESVLLGIPLPSLFVAATEDGWDVIDGVQRLSSIFSFMGILMGEDGEILRPFVCKRAPFLTELDGLVYESEGDVPKLSATQRIDFKRSRLDLKIIKRESDKRAKYDLFQRLNSYGTQATAQELRSALLVSISKEHFNWLNDLASDACFLECLSLPDRLIEEKYHVEIALRFVTLRKLPIEDLRSMGYLGEFLDSQVIPLTDMSSEELASESEVFARTFELLSEALGSDALRKWSFERDRPEGPFAATAFEVLALGLGYHDARADIDVGQVVDTRRKLWTDQQFASGFSQGIRADQRMRITVPYGREIFA